MSVHCQLLSATEEPHIYTIMFARTFCFFPCPLPRSIFSICATVTSTYLPPLISQSIFPHQYTFCLALQPAAAMVSTPGRSRASQGAQAEPAARQRSRSASPRRTPPPNLQRTYATPNQSQDAQSGVDNGQSTLLSPPHRAFQPERLHPDVTTPHPGVARLEGRRGIPATPRPVLLPESDIPTDVPLDDPFVDTPGRTPLDIEGFGLRPPPRGIPGEIVHRSPTESPIERHVRRRENRRAARQIRDDGPPRLPGAAELVFNPSAEGRVPRADPDLHDQHIQVQQTVREDTPDSAQQDWGSDRTPGSTEINHARPGFEHLPPDAGILEIDPTRVLPTIEEGRDQIRALHAQRQSYQVDERRFRHELVDRDDEIAHLQRQASEERRRGQHLPAAYGLLDQIHQRLDREHQDLRQRYEVLEGQGMQQSDLLCLKCTVLESIP